LRFLRATTAGLCAGLALAVAGCGGGGGSAGGVNAPAGADFAPADAAAFIAVDTNVDGQQWRTADVLASRFRGRSKVLDSIKKQFAGEGVSWEQDLKPSLGDTVYVVWLDFVNSGDNVVGFTKPRDAAKFDQALESGTSPAKHRLVDGWTVFADTTALLDRFEQAVASQGPLSDGEPFRQAFDGLPSPALVRAYVRGEAVQAEIDRSIAQGGGPAELTDKFGKLDSIGAATQAKSDGVLVTGNFQTHGGQTPKTYTAELLSDLPSGAIAYLSTGPTDDALKELLKTIGDTQPGFGAQRAQLEQAFGFTIDEDLLPLFSKEGAIAVYPEAKTPGFLFALAVPDEDKARSIVGRLAALVKTANGSPSVTTTTLAGVEVSEFALSGYGQSLYVAVSRGRLLATNNDVTLRRALGGGSSLADDAAYMGAREAAAVSNSTAGFLYLNLSTGLPYVFDFAEGQGNPVPKDVKDNVAPLRAFLVFGTQDGDATSLSGFLQVR
jgi:hypothetical protein